MVLLERSDLLIQMTPWIPELEPLLMYEYCEFKTGRGENSAPMEIKKVCMFKKTEDQKSGFFPAGYYESVINFLDKNHIEHEYKDYRNLKKLFVEPDWSEIPPLRPGQKEALEAITQHDHGLIVCATGFGKSFVCRQLCKLYPKSRFIIIAPGAADIRNLYYELDKMFPGEVALMGAGKHGDPSKRIALSTTKSVLKCDFNNCDFFIYDEAHGCGHNQSTQAILAHLGESRIYGFTATPVGRGDRTDKLMEAVFGPVIFEMTYQESQAVGNVSPIEVFIYDIGEQKIETTRFDSFISKKRKLYWRNTERNLSIACLARALPEDEQVLIMVETIDHIIHLATYLPEYTLVIGGTDDIMKRAKSSRVKIRNTIADNNKARQQVYQDFQSGKIKKVLCTGVWKQAVDFKQLSVLIRADGAPSPIASYQIPGRLSRIAEGKTKAILIDFRDTYNETAMRNYYARLRTYRKNGWTINHRGDVLNETFKDRI